jgi:hypothetical protein
LNPVRPLQLPLQSTVLTRSRSLLVLACTLLSALLVACGGSGGGGAATTPTGAQATLEKTFRSSATSIDRARLVADVRLAPEGLLALGGPLALHVSGPFAAPTRSSAARYDLALLATLGGQRFHGGAISTGPKSFLKLDDRTYAFAGARHAGTGKPHPGLTSLGIDPLRWITGARDRGAERVAGVDTKRISGDIDAHKLLADVGKLLDKAGGSSGSFLSPQLLTQIADAVKSAKADVWTGAGDGILRQLAVTVTFAFKAAQSPIVGLDGGKLTLRVRLDDVNGAPVRVAAPAGARPLAEVTGTGGLGSLLAGIGGGLSGGIGGGAVELVGCVSRAAGSAVDLVRCVSKLAP